jgi:signal transduction histidine kinase
MSHQASPLSSLPYPGSPVSPSSGAPDLSGLTLHATLADLPTSFFEVDEETFGHLVAQTFQQQPHLPGVIITCKEGKKVVTAVSRRRFLEHIGRPYGIEVYLNRSIRILAETIGLGYLMLSSQETILHAATIALQRPSDLIYEPIIIENGHKERRLLDVYILLLAQTQLLRLTSQVEQNRRQLAESLQKTGQMLVSSLSLETVTRRILKELSKVVAYERGTVFLYREDRLISLAQRGYPAHKEQTLEIQVRHTEDDVFMRILQTHKPVYLPDILAEPSWQQLDWLPLNHSWLGVPLIVQDRVTGMISLTRIQAYAFSADDMTVAQAFASQAAIALDNAHLYGQVQAFNEQLEGRVIERTAELNRAYAILEQLDRTKSDFIKVSAHELRTPLTIIKGYTQVLGLKTAGDPEVKRLVDGILEGTTRLHRLINSILDIAKIDSKALDMYREEVYLSDIITQLHEQLAVDLVTRQLTLVVDDLTAVPPIFGDAALLTKVFYSLLVNAIKYTPDEGQIYVSASVTTNDNGASERVEVVIHDTGIGIDPDHQELIFEKFYQTGQVALHSSGLTKFMGGGPGLGLAIAKGIVEAHNGRIWVVSNGRDEVNLPGSHFFVQLPLHETS